MRAIVFKDVFEMSNGTAWLVNRVVPDFKVYGGLIMNTVYGGMNPRAVKTALYYGDGAKYIDFGAHSTYFQAAKEGRKVDGKFVPLSEIYPQFKTEELDRCIRIPLDAPPGPELDQILQLIAAHPHVYMDTGHVSVPEAIRLAELAQQYGIKRFVVSSAVTKLASLEQLRYMAGKGAFLEFTLGGLHAHDADPQDPLLRRAGVRVHRRRDGGRADRRGAHRGGADRGVGRGPLHHRDRFRRVYPAGAGGRAARVHRLPAGSGDPGR